MRGLELGSEITDSSPRDAWKQQMGAVAHDWATFRGL
jgi:hypothetical protein